MKVRVKFRFNAKTGEVETFEIDDEGSTLAEAEHNQQHDRISAEIGNLVERNPRILEVLRGSAASAVDPQPATEAPTTEATTPTTGPRTKQ
jgi:hypothetical protein